MWALRSWQAGVLSRAHRCGLQRPVSTVEDLTARVLRADRAGRDEQLQLAHELLPECTTERRLESDGSMEWSEFTLEHEPTKTALAVLRAAKTQVVAFGQEEDSEQAIVFSTAVAHKALPFSTLMTPLLATAVLQLRTHESVDLVVANARLPGLCAWIKETRAWERPNFQQQVGDAWTDEVPGSVEAMALGRPRPGHSVLGQGTFNSARPGFELLAREYAKTTRDHTAQELIFYRETVKAELHEIRWMHDTSPEGLAESGGCTVTFLM